MKVLYKPEWISDLINSLKNERIYLIGIKAPLEVLEEREKKEQRFLLATLEAILKLSIME